MMQSPLPSQQYREFDVEMVWDISAIGSTTVIDGVIKNIRYAWMESVEIWVKHLDADGRIICRAVDLVTPNQLKLNDTTTFKVILPVIVPHGGKLVFIYSYYGYDGGDGTKWMQSFEAYVP